MLNALRPVTCKKFFGGEDAGGQRPKPPTETDSENKSGGALAAQMKKHLGRTQPSASVFLKLRENWQKRSGVRFDPGEFGDSLTKEGHGIPGDPKTAFQPLWHAIHETWFDRDLHLGRRVAGP